MNMKAVDPRNRSPKNVTYRTHPLNGWNRDRVGTYHLAHAAAAFVSNPAVTDGDRIAVALYELRKLGYVDYDEPERLVDWSTRKMICSLDDSRWCAFGPLHSSRIFRRLLRITRRTHIPDVEAEALALDLYGFRAIFNGCDALQEPYEFDFKGDPASVEAIFQAVGFSTRLSVSAPGEGFEGSHAIAIAPPTMVADVTP